MKRKDDPTYRLYDEEILPCLEEIYRSACGLLGRSSGEADDLVQEVFAQAWRSIDDYRPGSNARAWLYTILTNKARHVYRRRSKARVIPFSRHGDDGLAESIPATPPVPTELRDEEVLAALGQLSDDHRELVLLVDLRNFTYREAAEMLDLPIGTVMSRLSRARRQLRGALAEAAAEHGIDTSRTTETRTTEQ